MRALVACQVKFDMTLQEIVAPLGLRTYGDLARKAGLSRQRAHQIWYGRTGIGRRVAKRIAQAVGVPVGMVMGADLPKRKILLPRRRKGA